MSDTKNPLTGTSASAAAKTLAGTRAPELDVDWLGMDPTGAIAVFLGNEDTPVPSRADPGGTSAALELIAHSMRTRLGLTTNPEAAYRALGSRTQEPVFDAPRSSPTDALHESPFSGYPHLVVAAPGGEAMVRAFLSELGGREVLARSAFAVSLDVLGPISDEELHLEQACFGCRVLDDPNDPRPRSAEALASSGLYVYTVTKGGWIRVASPTVAADRDDLQGVGLRAVVEIAEPFESSLWLRHR